MAEDDVNKQGALDTACREARHTLDHQIEKVHKEDEKAIRLFRANVVLIGILISALTFSLQADSISTSQFLNLHIVTGFAAVMLSTVIAAMAYTSSEYEMGLGQQAISEAKDHGENGFYEELSEDYKRWTKANQSVHEFNAHAIMWTIILTMGSVVYFIGGFMVGSTSIKGSTLSYALIISESVIFIGLFIIISMSDEIFDRLNGS